MEEWNKIHRKLDAYLISKKTKFLQDKLSVSKIE